MKTLLLDKIWYKLCKCPQLKSKFASAYAEVETKEKTFLKYHNE